MARPRVFHRAQDARRKTTAAPGPGLTWVTRSRCGEAEYPNGVSFDHGTQDAASYGIMGDRRLLPDPEAVLDYWYRNAYANVAPPTWPTAGKPAGLKFTSSTTSLTAVDGTQDAWLLVTVVDGTGKPINNNVAVTLTIVSGPGEFPTGPSITFTPPGSGAASDIAILDGQAATEFRTDYSGTSVIQATSPGLTSASITITSQGSPAWIQGTTAPVAPRPYPHS